MSMCSIIIPVFNRASLTKQCLDVLLKQLRGQAHCEIIVADDGSTDDTPTILRGYRDLIRIVDHGDNRGFAAACNSGAAVASGEFLAFLNNDTLPTDGWLDALLREAERHPAAAVVGAKLLYTNNTVQHAGIVFDGRGYPRHIYAGFPADHPAVNHSRRFQAVTAACALVRRGAFDSVGGFDRAYRNGLEDVDLCLTLGRRGHEIQYCHESVLFHLESLSEGRFTANKDNQRVYRQRWASRVQRDDVRYYAEDELFQLDYVDGDTCPLRLRLSPLLALIDQPQSETSIGRLLRLRSRQVQVLLKEVVRLTAQMGLPTTVSAPLSDPCPRQGTDQLHLRQRLMELEAELLQRDQDTLVAISALQTALSESAHDNSTHTRFARSERLHYEQQISRLRKRIRDVVPAGAKLAVVSRGDEEFLHFDGLTVSHFPQTNAGDYSGHHPEDSAEAIAQLEVLAGRGFEYLLFPVSALWWLEHYADFARHLDCHYSVVMRDEQSGVLFALSTEQKHSRADKHAMERRLHDFQGVAISTPISGREEGRP